MTVDRQSIRLPILAGILTGASVLGLLLLAAPSGLRAADEAEAPPARKPTILAPPKPSKIELPSSTQSDPDARIIEVGIPAPRGLIGQSAART